MSRPVDDVEPSAAADRAVAGGCPLGVGVLRARLEAAEFALSRVRALVREHPADAVPLLELAVVARAAGVEVEG